MKSPMVFLILFIISLLFLLPFNCSTINTVINYEWDVTVHSGLHGSVCNEGTRKCGDEDSLVLIVCSTDYTYQFKEWVIDSGKGNCTIDNKHNDTAVIRNFRGAVVIHPEFTHQLFTLKTICDSVGSVSVSVSSIDNVPYNTPIKINAAATAKDTSQYVFTRWMVDSGAAVIKNDSITLTSDVKIRAVFTVRQYTLGIVNPQPSGGSVTLVSPAVSDTYDFGTPVELSASALNGWQFVNWTATAGAIPTGPSTAGNATLTANTNYSAVFTKKSYTLTVSSPNANVSLNPPVPTFYYDSATTFSATVSGYNTAQYQFNNTWTVTNGSFNSDYSRVTLLGDAVASPVLTERQYSFTINTNPAEGGGITSTPAPGTYTYGASIQLIATPNTGWHFVRWTGGDVNGATTPTVTAHIGTSNSFYAVFERNNYTLTITQPAHGTITASPTGTSYPYGTVVTLTATADTAYQFSAWSGNALGTTATTTITIDTNKTVSGSFGEIPGGSGVVYVRKGATGSNSGSNWANAYTDLKSAFTAGGADKTYWVAGGEYRVSDSTVTNSFFTPQSGSQVYGGFSGFETLLNQRTWYAHPTIIHGGNDGTRQLYLFFLSNTNDIRLNGLVFERALNSCILVQSTAIRTTIENCILRDNATGVPEAFRAIIINGDNTTISNCVFYNNGLTTAATADGHCIHITASAAATKIVNCLFAENRGPVILNANTDVDQPTQIINCTVANNRSISTQSSPGGVATNTRALQLRGCILWGNTTSRTDGTQLDSAAEITFSCIQGGIPGGILRQPAGAIYELNTYSNPVFGLPTIPTNIADFYSTSDADVHFLPTSSDVLNKASFGNEIGRPAYDLRGRGRSSPDFDMGAYETP